MVYHKRLKSISFVLFVTSIMLLFNNCQPLTSSNKIEVERLGTMDQDTSSDHLGNNGNGYVGIDAPVTVKPGGSYVARAYGGQKPYVFDLVSGSASIVSQGEDFVEIKVDIGAGGEEIRLKVVDDFGLEATTSTLVIAIGDPYKLSDIKHSFYSPRVKMMGNLTVVGKASSTYFDYKRMDSEYDGPAFDYTHLKAGHVSIHKHDGRGRNWSIPFHMTGVQAIDVLTQEWGLDWVVPYDFGEYFDFDGETLVVRFGIMTSNSLNSNWSLSDLDRVIMVFKVDSKTGKATYKESIISSIGCNRYCSLNKKVFLVRKSIFAVDDLSQGYRDRSIVYSPTLNGDFEERQVIDFKSDDTSVKNIFEKNGQAYVFLSPAVSSASFRASSTGELRTFDLLDGEWQLHQVVPVSDGGTAIAMTTYDGGVVVNHLVSEYLDSNGIKAYKQKLTLFESKNEIWSIKSRLNFNDFSICRGISGVNNQQFVLGCDSSLIYHVHAQSVNVAYDTGVDLYKLMGSAILISIDQDQMVMTEKIYEPEGGDPNYSGFGWSVSGADGFFAISHYFTEQVKVFHVQ